MKPILFTTRDEEGELSGGWLRVATGGRHLSMQEHAIQLGLDASRAPGITAARRAEIAQWVQRATDDWPLPQGEYPLAGRAAVVIENDTHEARARFRTEGEYRDAARRASRRTAQPPARPPTSDAAAKARAAKAVQAARQALTQKPRKR
jgi:hypothetical protein